MIKVLGALIALSISLTSCSAKQSAALEPLSHICWGVKYLSERSYTIQDDELRKVFAPLIENAKELEPDSTQVLDLSDNLDGAFEIGRLTKAVNAKVEAMQYSNMPIDELLSESKALFDELAKSKFPEYVDDSCLEIRKQWPESEIKKADINSIKKSLEAYVKSVEESPYKIEHQRAEKTGAAAAAKKNTRDMQVLVPFCVDKAAPEYMDELRSMPVFLQLSQREVDNIQTNFIFACENWWGFI
jgi:hypothetical protein